MESEEDETINISRKEKNLVKKFEKETGKNAIWRGKITKNYLDWKKHQHTSESMVEEKFDDIGADTAKRYRYQHFWTVYIILEMFLKDRIKAVYCEYYDDITVDLDDNIFKVIQIKTKNTEDKKKFSLSDKNIGRSLDIFFSLEKRFQKRIMQYEIRTDVGFIHKKNDTDIQNVIDMFRKNSNKINNKAYDIISKKSSIKSIKDYDKNIIFQVFKKLRIPKYPISYEKLNQEIDAKIARILNKYNIYGENRRIPKIKSQLMDLVYRKSSNDKYDSKSPIYGIYPESQLIKSIDAKESKCILKMDVFSIFRDIFNEFEKKIEKLNITSQLDENEKESLKKIQLNLRTLINEVNLISKSSKNGIVIRNGNIIRLKLTKLKPFIKAIPKEIFKLKKLEFISLTNNQIKNIPKEIKNLKNLIEIHLDHNKISQIPKEIEKLRNLEIFSIQNNRIEEIEGTNFKMINLKEFNISFNPLKKIIKGKLVNNLNRIDLSFTSLPEETLKLFKKSNLILNNSDRFPYEKYCNYNKDYRFSFDDYNEVSLKKNSIEIFKSPIYLAYFLKIHLKTLQKILRGLTTNIRDYYNLTFIRKSNHKVRYLQIPKNDILKKIQNIIYRDILKNIDMGVYSYGFINNRSAVKNARCHLNSNLLINLDLKNFFTYITADHIIHGFRSLGFSTGISAILTRLTTYTNNNSKSSLPQGTHSSPSIANLVFKPIDSDLGKLANYYDFRYTRYGDDLCFSSTEKRHAPKDFVNQIFKIVRKNNFIINQRKISFTRKHQKQVVTGILVNGGECSLPRKRVKRIRAGLYQLDNEEIGLKQKMHIYGMCLNALDVNRRKYSYLLDKFKEIEPEFLDDYSNGVFHEEYNFLNELRYI